MGENKCPMGDTGLSKQCKILTGFGFIITEFTIHDIVDCRIQK
jgi:hypothetical protein